MGSIFDQNTKKTMKIQNIQKNTQEYIQNIFLKTENTKITKNTNDFQTMYP